MVTIIVAKTRTWTKKSGCRRPHRRGPSRSDDAWCLALVIGRNLRVKCVLNCRARIIDILVSALSSSRRRSCSSPAEAVVLTVALSAHSSQRGRVWRASTVSRGPPLVSKPKRRAGPRCARDQAHKNTAGARQAHDAQPRGRTRRQPWPRPPRPHNGRPAF